MISFYFLLDAKVDLANAPTKTEVESVMTVLWAETRRLQFRQLLPNRDVLGIVITNHPDRQCQSVIKGGDILLN